MRSMVTFFTRTSLFLVINALVFITLMVTVNLIFSFFDIQAPDHLTFYLIFAICFGMGGSVISLFLSKSMAKRFMKLSVIDEESLQQDEKQKWLLERVHYFSRKGGLKKMPEVAIYQSQELNAFATGPSKNDSLVAVSSGLLSSMSSSEVEGVLAHEVSHITNGDMVSMALLQGVINTLAIFIGRILAKMVMELLKTDSILIYFVLISVFEILLTLLGSIGVYKFSRWREFRADKGGARLAGKEKMISALQALQRYSDINNLAFQQNTSVESRKLDTFKISGKQKTSLVARLFSSHPPLEKRIRALERSRIGISR